MQVIITFLPYVPLAALVLAFGAAVIAYLSWRSKQHFDRRNIATSYSLTVKQHYYEAITRVNRRFGRDLANGKRLSTDEADALLRLSSDTDTSDSDAIVADIRFILSHWELMAISILDGIADEKTCFEMVGFTFVDTVQLFEEYIKLIRKQPDHKRRYDHVLILNEEWKRRIEKMRTAQYSRYDRYMASGQSRKLFERPLLFDRSDW